MTMVSVVRMTNLGVGIAVMTSLRIMISDGAMRFFSSPVMFSRLPGDIFPELVLRRFKLGLVHLTSSLT